MRAADGQVRTLPLNGPYHPDEFTWTPEGDGVLYARTGDCRGTCDIKLSGSAPAPVDPRQVIGPWANDHSQMAFMLWSAGKKVEADNEIWLYDYSRRESRPLVRDSDLITPDQSRWTSAELAPMPWSADGKWLAFTAQRGDTDYWAWIAARDGSAYMAVAEGSVVAWMPD